MYQREFIVPLAPTPSQMEEHWTRSRGAMWFKLNGNQFRFNDIIFNENQFLRTQGLTHLARNVKTCSVLCQRHCKILSRWDEWEAIKQCRLWNYFLITHTSYMHNSIHIYILLTHFIFSCTHFLEVSFVCRPHVCFYA